jgi:hypothetical protein
MFKASAPAPAAVPVSEPVEVDRDELIPLSHLSLDLPTPPEGWPVYLGRRGVSFTSDDLGRDSVSRGDAKRLLDEARADELRRRAQREVAEQAAVEADQLRRARIWQGVPASAIPEGVSAGDAMAQAAKDGVPRRRSMVEEAFEGSGTTFHPWPTEEAS